MGSSCFSFSGCRFRSNPFFSRLKVQLPPQARTQSFGDEGNSSNTVDAEMSVLRYRIEQVRMKDGSNRCGKLIKQGWNYRRGYDVVQKKHNMLLTSIQLASIVGSTIGLVFLSGSLCIFLVSLIVHHARTN